MVDTVQIDTTSNTQAAQEVPEDRSFGPLSRTRSV